MTDDQGTPLERLLGDTEGENQGEGSFSLSPEAVKSRYEKVVDDPKLALLFFIQAAERWGTPRLDIKVLKWSVRLTFDIPKDHQDWAREIRDDADGALHKLYAPEHPLYELAHGYLILSQGHQKARHSLGVDESLKSLTYTCDEKHIYRFRLVSQARMFRVFFATSLGPLICTTVPTWIDGVRLKTPKFEMNTAYVLGLSTKNTSHNRAFKPESESDTALSGDVSLRLGASAEPAVFHHSSAFDFTVLNGKTPRDLVGFIPVIHGMALSPLPDKLPPFNGAVYFSAEHLRTDFGRLDIIVDEECLETLEQLKSQLARVLKVIKERGEDSYQLTMTSVEILKSSAKESLWAGMVGGQVTGMSPHVLSAVAVGTFVVRGSRAIKPENAAKKVARSRFKWLDEPELVQFLQRYDEPGEIIPAEEKPAP